MKKIAMVTGVAGGIGSAVAKTLAEKGYTVVGMDVVSADKVNLIDGMIYQSGDLSKKADREAFLELAKKAEGEIAALVNVAGVAPRVRADLLEMTEESYDFVMEINTKGTLFLTQAVAREMIANQGEKKGAIVNISSMSAYTSSVNRGEYCISKAGVSMITSLFADRLAEYGIPVNEIRPGIIETGMTATVKEKYDRFIFQDHGVPLKRWGKPQDVADAVLALVDGSLPYVTGQSLDVDGGFHIRRL